MNITSVAIEDGVTSIGALAFESSTLTSINIPDSVTYIGKGAFWASALESIVIPDSITEIQYGTFYFCDKLTSVELPDTLTRIGESAFSYSCLDNMEIPDSVIEVESWAFAWSALTSAKLSKSMNSVGESIFNGCSSLATVYIPVTIAYEEGKNPFGYCVALTDVYYSGSEKEWYENSWDLDANLAAANIHFNGYSMDTAVLGDANGDEKIDYLDAMTALRADAELIELTDEQLSAADVNGDGSVDSLDAILILRYDAGLIESF